MNTVTSTNDVVDDVYPLFDLNEDEMSALVALYTLEKTEGTAAYAVDEQIGVWLFDVCVINTHVTLCRLVKAHYQAF